MPHRRPSPCAPPAPKGRSTTPDLGPDGVWGELYTPRRDAHRAALFLDRDGVIVEEVHYLGRAEDVRLVPGAASTVAAANRAQVPVVVVTNQAGIGRGHYGWDGYFDSIDEMRRLLAIEGAAIDAAFACPFHAEARPPYDAPDHPGRKPNPGMLVRAARDLDLDLASSWIVGDTVADVLTGRAAGLAGAVHVLTGHGAREREALVGMDLGTFRLELAADLGEAARLVSRLANGERSGDAG